MITPSISPPDDSTVLVATREDVEQAFANALRSAGCTYEELRQQARTGAFQSAAAHRAWAIVRCLVKWLQPPS